jgi:hypothetical protein
LPTLAPTMFTRYANGGCRCALALAALLLVFAQGTVAARGKPAGEPRLLASDTGVAPNPVPFWGAIECQNPGRHLLVPVGGDVHPTLTGEPQGNLSYRRMTVMDGDDFYGERCELGLNNRHGPTAFYREGRRRTTAISLRLEPTLPIDTTHFQVVTQMKQTQPSPAGGGSPMFELQVFMGRWKLIQSRRRGLTSDSRELWSAPAQTGVWTRFWFDIRYSRRPKKGFVQVSADLNGDNDSADPGERSARIRTFTLKTEIRGGAPDGLPAGRSIPSHLRAGIYHDPAISCPPPLGCQLDVDNVQVMGR